MGSSLRSREYPVCVADRTKNYNGIDVMKFICAIMVFVIHIPPFQTQTSGILRYLNFGLQHYICRLAVPFYFVASGFFLFKKMPAGELNVQTVKAYCFKILRLAGIWHVLLFMGGTVHLWYLGATVIAVTLVSLCVHFSMRFRNICILAGLLYICGLLGDAYYGVIAPLADVAVLKYLIKGYGHIFTTTRNGVFMGFIFVVMGMAFSRYKIGLRPATALMGLVISVLCLFGEVFLLKYNGIPIEYNMYVFLLPATYFLFAFASGVQLKDRAIYKHLRNMGTFIYFSHLLINSFTSFGIVVIQKCFGVDASPLRFVMSLFLTCAAAVFVRWLSLKEKFKWINWFVS